MKLAISSFYDTMGEDDGNIRHEPPEEVEQVRFLNFFRLIQNIFLSLCENCTKYWPVARQFQDMNGYFCFSLFYSFFCSCYLFSH